MLDDQPISVVRKLNAPFIVLALPRSRTTWLSRFLSYRDWHCGHEELRHMRGLDDVRSWLAQEKTGTAETSAAPWWRMIAKYRPDIRVLVVRRPVAEVVDSLMALGLFRDRDVMAKAMARLDAKLSQAERRMPNVLSVRFENLKCEATCARAFEHCLGLPHDAAWWRGLASVNIQCSMQALIRYAAANMPQLTRLASIAKQEILTDLACHPVEAPDGMTFQQDTFEDFYRDGQRLFASHLAQVGESPDAFSKKNLDLMRRLDGLGNMQIVTARSNGRMFGYLMTVLSPSLESPDLRSAIHTTFFASPDVPGLGLKLQRHALAALRERGLDEVWWRAGPRGDGPRMGTLYRRLGASPDGEIYRLDLRSA